MTDFETHPLGTGADLEKTRAERDAAVAIIRRLLECRRTCPSILRFAVTAREILTDATRWR